MYDTIIPRSVRLSEAPSYGLPIALYRPDSKGAEAYRALAAEFIDRGAGVTDQATGRSLAFGAPPVAVAPQAIP